MNLNTNDLKIITLPRAPKMNVFHIDISSMSPDEASQYIKDLQALFGYPTEGIQAIAEFQMRASNQQQDKAFSKTIAPIQDRFLRPNVNQDIDQDIAGLAVDKQTQCMPGEVIIEVKSTYTLSNDPESWKGCAGEASSSTQTPSVWAATEDYRVDGRGNFCLNDSDVRKREARVDQIGVVAAAREWMNHVQFFAGRKVIDIVPTGLYHATITLEDAKDEDVMTVVRWSARAPIGNNVETRVPRPSVGDAAFQDASTIVARNSTSGLREPDPKPWFHIPPSQESAMNYNTAPVTIEPEATLGGALGDFANFNHVSLANTLTFGSDKPTMQIDAPRDGSNGSLILYDDEGEMRVYLDMTSGNVHLYPDGQEDVSQTCTKAAQTFWEAIAMACPFNEDRLRAEIEAKVRAEVEEKLAAERQSVWETKPVALLDGSGKIFYDYRNDHLKAREAKADEMGAVAAAMDWRAHSGFMGSRKLMKACDLGNRSALLAFEEESGSEFMTVVIWTPRADKILNSESVLQSDWSLIASVQKGACPSSLLHSSCPRSSLHASSKMPIVAESLSHPKTPPQDAADYESPSQDGQFITL